MAKFNGLTLASNSALGALLAGTKTESDRNNAIAAVFQGSAGASKYRIEHISPPQELFRVSVSAA